MKNAKVAKSWSMHNVPPDIFPEILSRLPVKSLVRFRCVSKSWRLLIDDPDFCHLHLNHFKNNAEETHLLFVEGWTRYGYIRCSETFKTTRRLGCLGSRDRSSKTYRSTATPGYNSLWNIRFSGDGLVLLKSRKGTELLMLWNPSIRKFRPLPASPDISSDEAVNIDLGLGFDPVIKDYKLIRVALHNKSARAVSIYTVGTDSWKTIQFRGRGVSNSSWEVLSCFYTKALESVYFKCCLYFISSLKELASFDLSNEVLTFANMPEYDDHIPHLGTLAFVDGGCSLAVFRCSLPESSLWVLENWVSSATSLCWTKRCTITRSIPRFVYLKRNGDLLGTFYQWRQLISYNIETQEEKLVPNALRSKVIDQVFSYKESLVLLK